MKKNLKIEGKSLAIATLIILSNFIAIPVKSIENSSETLSSVSFNAGDIYLARKRRNNSVKGKKIQQYWQNAYRSFTQKNNKNSANEIRQGVILLKRRAERNSGKSRSNLLNSATELSQLADRIEQGKVSNSQELKKAFAKVELNLASVYLERAETNERDRGTSLQTGRALKATIGSLMLSTNWMSKEKRKEVTQAIQDARKIANDLIKGQKKNSAEIQKAISILKEQIDKLNQQIAMF
jgi:hypothetical protein